MQQLKEEYQLPIYLFHDGTNYKAYEFFGVHKIKKNTWKVFFFDIKLFQIGNNK